MVDITRISEQDLLNGKSLFTVKYRKDLAQKEHSFKADPSDYHEENGEIDSDKVAQKLLNDLGENPNNYRFI